jgi:sortase (surface protein transpeptidase)
VSDRRRAGAALACAALIVSVAACGGSPPQDPVPLTIAAQPTPETTTSLAPKAAKVAVPSRIRIPSIDVDASIVKIGLKANGDMVTPKPGKAGWYSPKPPKGKPPVPRPGEPGPAVIAAHVDSRTGPDVFARLKELKPGAEIRVTDQGGATYTFAMQRMKQTPKDELPKQEIWGETDGPTLRLITCGGSFDHATGHYRDNVTIFADAA